MQFPQSNLISNAIRYTSFNGNISIFGACNKLAIKNSCTPLNEEQLSQIFDAFYRPDFARDAYSDGSGFGLFKNLLEANELNYSFKTYTKGMCFTIFLYD